MATNKTKSENEQKIKSILSEYSKVEMDSPTNSNMTYFIFGYVSMDQLKRIEKIYSILQIIPVANNRIQIAVEVI